MLEFVKIFFYIVQYFLIIVFILCVIGIIYTGIMELTIWRNIPTKGKGPG